MQNFSGLLSNLKRMAAPIGVLAIAIGLAIPLPAQIISLLIAVNIAMAMLILLVVLTIREPLEISVFPTMLIALTIFRIVINTSVTKLILTQGDAGEVIDAFGTYVVRGDVIVGIVAFFILAVVQFVVTSGAGRSAEVAARFTLDAMPVKQMAIEGRLNSGQITDQEAEVERRKVEKEADFFGAMDGAARMVKFDTIAAVIILLLNLVGGIAIGTVRMGMGIGAAASTFATLTIGDGLSAIIPALLLSVATAMIVTRAASGDDFTNEMFDQLGRHASTLYVVAGVMFALGLIPGMPKLPFFVLAAALVGLGYMAGKRWERIAAEEVARIEEEQRLATAAAPDEVKALLAPQALEVMIGIGLLTALELTEEETAAEFAERIKRLRANLSAEMGFPVPKIRVRDHIDLEPNHYEIKLRGENIADGTIMPGYVMALNPQGGDIELPGLDTIEPVGGHTAKLIRVEDEQKAENLGYQTIDPRAQLLTHLSHVIRSSADDLLTLETVGNMVEDLKQTHPTTVEELIPNRISVGELHRVLQSLLSEGVPIRDLEAICTVIAPIAQHSRDAANRVDIGMLAEAARGELRRAIMGQNIDRLTGKLQAVVVSPLIEQEIASSIVQGSFGHLPALTPERMQAIGESLVGAYNEAHARGVKPVILCNLNVRRHLAFLLRQFNLNLPVIAYSEVPPNIEVESVGFAQLAAPVESGAAEIPAVG